VTGLKDPQKEKRRKTNQNQISNRQELHLMCHINNRLGCQHPQYAFLQAKEKPIQSKKPNTIFTSTKTLASQKKRKTNPFQQLLQILI
jgi:hypothetical protein